MTTFSRDDGDHRLADPADTRSNCGVGVVMDLDGDGGHWVLSDGLELLENLEHRGTTGAEAATGDGAGVMIQTPHEFFADEVDADLIVLGYHGHSHTETDQIGSVTDRVVQNAGRPVLVAT